MLLLRMHAFLALLLGGLVVSALPVWQQSNRWLLKKGMDEATLLVGVVGLIVTIIGAALFQMV